MKATEFAAMPARELEQRVADLREEIFHLRFKGATEPVTDPAGLRNKRKEIAVLKTVLRQKELGDAERETRKLSRAERKRRRKINERRLARTDDRAKPPSPRVGEGDRVMPDGAGAETKE
ncbi:50S ribosomal protein L29 [Planctomycetota bacterium]